nr:hypothetical protein [Carnobacterium funditum]
MGNYAGSIAKSTIHVKGTQCIPQIETKVDLDRGIDLIGYFLASRCLERIRNYVINSREWIRYLENSKIEFKSYN